MSFVTANVKRERLATEAENKRLWRSHNGWVFPGVPSSEVANQHPDRLDPASLDRLQEEWEENSLHTSILKSPLPNRVFLPHQARDRDFDVWSKPLVAEETKRPVTIFDAGDTKTRHDKENQSKENEKWRAKLVVDNVDVKVHKLLSETENRLAGGKSSNQLDKLKGLLKDKPTKKGLLAGGVDFNAIPALDVMKMPYEDVLRASKGFTALSAESGFRITDSKNAIPVHFYNRAKLKQLNGKDFE